MGFSDDVATWLERAQLDDRGREKMKKAALCKAAKVSPDTLYRLLRGEGEPDQSTIDRLAAALEVSAPRVELVLQHDQPISEPKAPLAILRAATGLLQRLDDQLATSSDVDTDADSKDERPLERSARLAKEQAAANRRRRRGRKRSSGE